MTHLSIDRWHRQICLDCSSLFEHISSLSQAPDAAAAQLSLYKITMAPAILGIWSSRLPKFKWSSKGLGKLGLAQHIHDTPYGRCKWQPAILLFYFKFYSLSPKLQKLFYWWHTGLHQEGAYTYSGISCPECVHQFFCCLLMHNNMHFVCKLQLDLNADTKVYAFKFITPHVCDVSGETVLTSSLCMSVCLSVCVCVTTFPAKRTDRRTWISACRSSGRISRLRLKVKVKCQGHQVKNIFGLPIADEAGGHRCSCQGSDWGIQLYRYNVGCFQRVCFFFK